VRAAAIGPRLSACTRRCRCRNECNDRNDRN